jgi:hypothetical protein
VAVPFAPPRPFVYLAPAPPPPPCLPGLRGLVLDGNFGVSDELLASLLAHAPQLRSLNLVLAGGSVSLAAGVVCGFFVMLPCLCVPLVARDAV